jgi:hypothetical protein
MPESEPDQTATETPTSGEVGVAPEPVRPVEIGGRNGPEPTRYGDWEKNGRCIDF